MTTHKIIRIDAQSQKTTLSAAQKQFNSLTKKIESQKQQLIEWEKTIPLYQQKFNQEYLPLCELFSQKKVDWVRLLDSLYNDKIFKKTDQMKMEHLICQLCEQLINEDDYLDEEQELKSIFNQYSDDDYDSLKEEAHLVAEQLAKSFAKNLFNVDIDDDIDLSSPEKFHAHLQDKMREQSDQQTQTAIPAQERKKTKKQLENEARLQQEEALAKKSVQEIYRKLVTSLHPDREPDLQERERKTELMQRVNIAYGKKDLLQLLALQLEIEQIDPLHLNEIADSRLKHFNKILKEQSLELSQKLDEIEDMFKFQCHLPFYQRLTTKKLMSILSSDIKELKYHIASIEDDLRVFKQPTALKAWLKNYRIDS